MKCSNLTNMKHNLKLNLIKLQFRSSPFSFLLKRKEVPNQKYSSLFKFNRRIITFTNKPSLLIEYIKTVDKMKFDEEKFSYIMN
jgi:hypothetical protein